MLRNIVPAEVLTVGAEASIIVAVSACAPMTGKFTDPC